MPPKITRNETQIEKLVQIPAVRCADGLRHGRESRTDPATTTGRKRETHTQIPAG